MRRPDFFRARLETMLDLRHPLAVLAILMQQVKGVPRPITAIVDLGYRGVELPGVEIIHRGWLKSLTAKARRLLKRRQAVEPVVGHLKDDCGMCRNWLKGQLGDALRPVLCAAGYKLRWLLRAVARLGSRPFLRPGF